MDYRILSEIGLNDTLLLLEPSRRCVAHCTWCYVELNGRAARARGEARPDVGPDTFTRAVNRAFGPEYDPTHFLQWGLRNKLPLAWSSGVEPWQDAAQAAATLDVADRLDLPLFVQTRGTRWREAWPRVLDRARQIALYVSMPSDDPAYVKRFEPGTPPPAERIALLEAAAEAGIPTMLAVAPYHPEWCPDPAGLVGRAIDDWGVRAVLADPLHLNPVQLAAATDPALAPLLPTAWGEQAVARLAGARAACLDRGASWHMPSWKAPIHRLESVGAFDWTDYADAMPFGYHDDAIFEVVHALVDADDAPPLLLTWPDALAILERHGAIDQRFAWNSIGQNVRACTRLPVAWRDRLKAGATVADYLRAAWNNPVTRRCRTPSGFLWRHPFVRLPVRPDGTPWTSESGDLLAMFDPNYEPKTFERVVEDPAVYEFLTPVEEVADGCE